MEANGLPSRTSILTAAARAFGSREPDVSVRNPDWVAERLIGPDELALIAEHPISKALGRDFQDAIYDPEVFGFVWLMLVRTRFIDERGFETKYEVDAKGMVIGVTRDEQNGKSLSTYQWLDGNLLNEVDPLGQGRPKFAATNSEGRAVPPHLSAA